jgi:hypothetical protein
MILVILHPHTRSGKTHLAKGIAGAFDAPYYNDVNAEELRARRPEIFTHIGAGDLVTIVIDSSLSKEETHRCFRLCEEWRKYTEVCYCTPVLPETIQLALEK